MMLNYECTRNPFILKVTKVDDGLEIEISDNYCGEKCKKVFVPEYLIGVLGSYIKSFERKDVTELLQDIQICDQAAYDR